MCLLSTLNYVCLLYQLAHLKQQHEHKLKHGRKAAVIYKPEGLESILHHVYFLAK